MLNGMKTKNRYLIFVVLALATLLTYADSVGNSFTWDDVPLIVNNPAYKNPANLPVLFKSSDTSPIGEQVAYFRPVNNLSYLLDFQLYGLNPLGYHVENVMLHLIAVLLLYTLIDRLFFNGTLAFLSALIFAVHPINTEAVAFIAARNNVLALVFMLLSFITYISAHNRKKVISFFFSGLFFFLSALCKESTLMLPFILGLYDFKFSRSFKEQVRLKIVTLSPFVLFSAVYFAMRAHALASTVGIGLDIEGLGQRMLKNIYIIPKYLVHFIYPLNLSIIYSMPENYLSGSTWLFLLWVAILLILFFLLRLRNAVLNFGLLWFAVNFVPVSNIVPISFPASLVPMADRFMYLPAIGLYIIAAECLYYSYTRFKWKKTVIFSAVAVILALSFLTVRRNLDWKDDLTLFKSTVRSQPNAVVGHYNLGCEYKDRGDLINAEKEWKETLRLNPRHEGALINLGNLYNLLNVPLEAKNYYYRAIESNPSNSVVHYNLALALEQLSEQDEALRHYEVFLRTVTPEFSHLIPKARSNMDALRKGLSRISH